MRTFIFAVFALLVLAASVHAAPPTASSIDGLIVKPSKYTVAKTLDRLERLLKQKGITVFARVDHKAGGRKAGLTLRPTQVLIFGNPKLGTPLMQSAQTAGIDLPMKALAWQDENGKTWLAYNDPAYVNKRHGITGRAEVSQKMAGALKALTDKATE